MPEAMAEQTVYGRRERRRAARAVRTTTLPVVDVVLPTGLNPAMNGYLPAAFITSVYGGGGLHRTAARAWNALVAAAKRDGITLTYTPGGTYRTYDAQVTLFRSRYTLLWLPFRPTKRWDSDGDGDTEIWYQLPNTAMAAVPGTSNHGLGLAIDTALNGYGSAAQPITPALDWMLDHAPLYGFSWEAQSEPWHIRYVTGDRIPLAVLAYEDSLKPPPPEDPDMAQLIQADDGDAAVFLVAGGVATWVRSRNDITLYALSGIIATTDRRKVNRVLFKSLALGGSAPVYPAETPGPYTTAAHFREHLT